MSLAAGEAGGSSLPDNFDELPVAQQIELLRQLDQRLRSELEGRMS